MKRLFVTAVAAALLCGMTGCSGDQLPVSSSPTTTAPVTSTTAPATTATPRPEYRNPLTGLADVNSDQTRPVAVMIGNNDKSRPQYGIETADLLIEGETEGGITRIMAVWADVSRVPDAVGPIRSARSPFVKLAVALDAVYAHCGGSPGGLSALTSSNLAELDGMTYDGSTFWRDQGLMNSKGYEYSMLTGGGKLQSRIADLGFRTTANNDAPFVFGDKEGGQSATEAQIFFSNAQTISFRYDASDGLYYKRNGSLSGGSAHVTASGEQLSAANVIVMYDGRYVEQTSTWDAAIYGYNMSSGSGKLLSGGTARSINWTRTDSGLSFAETDGTALTVATGRTYLCLVYSGYASNTVIR